MEDQNINNQSDLQVSEEDKKALLVELGIADLPEDQQNELLSKMTEAIIKKILLEVLERLSEEDKNAYEQMIDREASPEELDAFIREKIPDYDKLAAKVVSDFKEEMKKEL